MMPKRKEKKRKQEEKIAKINSSTSLSDYLMRWWDISIIINL